MSASVTTETVEGVPRATWVRHLGDVLAQDRDFLSGPAYLHSEFEACNLDTTDGLRAVGQGASRHLPGLYWLNYFGGRYAALMRVCRPVRQVSARGRPPVTRSRLSAAHLPRGGCRRPATRRWSWRHLARICTSIAACRTGRHEHRTSAFLKGQGRPRGSRCSPVTE
jgi:hypothetical protein